MRKPVFGYMRIARLILACTSAQSVQDRHCPLTGSLDRFVDSKDPDDTLRMRKLM